MMDEDNNNMETQNTETPSESGHDVVVVAADDVNGGDVSSGEEDSFRTCENVVSGAVIHYPPELSDESDGSDNNSSELFLSDNGHSDDYDSDISNPARERRESDEGRGNETSFQRELLDYLGSLFNVNSRTRSRDSRQPVTVNEEQLEEYKTLREKVEREMKVLGVGDMLEVASSDQSVARNLYNLLGARERGDWGGIRKGLRVVPLWTYKEVIGGRRSCDSSGRRTKKTKKMKVMKEKKIVKDNELKGNDSEGNLSDKEKIMKEIEYVVELSKDTVDNNSMDNVDNAVTLERGVQLWSEDDNDCDYVGGGFIGPRRVIDNNSCGHYGDKVKNVLCKSQEDTSNGLGKRDRSVKDEEEEERQVWKRSKRESGIVEEEGEVRQVSRSGQRDIKSAVYGSRWAVSRLGLERRIAAHEGCVNALNFSRSGQWLASGSDDRQVVITDWQQNEQLSRFSVGHTSNIFQVRFLPSSNDLELVTCSRDKSVRYGALSSTGQLQYSRLLAKHSDACHKMDMPLDQPRVVISAGEDCRVLSTDVRAARSSGQLCIVDKVPLYSISCNPVRSQEFCVAGKDNHVFIFDRRKSATCLYELCPSQLAERPRGGHHVTSVVYSGDGNSVLCSYNDEDIYLLPSGGRGSGDTAHRYVGHRNVQTVTGVSFYGPQQQFIVSGSNDGHVLLWERESECLLHWLLADEAGVVNVLEPHPSMPLLATSGLDHDIKLWSMLAADSCGAHRRAVVLDSAEGGLLDRDQETSRIDLAWRTLSDNDNNNNNNQKKKKKKKNRMKMNNDNDNNTIDRNSPPSSTSNISLSQQIQQQYPQLPFNLHNLQVITALNWKMRAESYPYSFDNSLENLIFMSRRHGESQLRNLIISDSDSGDSADQTMTSIAEEQQVAESAVDTAVQEPSNSDSNNEGRLHRHGPDSCRTS